MKSLTNKWQEALSMMSDCKIVRKPVAQGKNVVILLLADMVDQKFIIQFTADASPGAVGNLIGIFPSMKVEAFELEKGDRYEDIIF